MAGLRAASLPARAGHDGAGQGRFPADHGTGQNGRSRRLLLSRAARRHRDDVRLRRVRELDLARRGVGREFFEKTKVNYLKQNLLEIIYLKVVGHQEPNQIHK